jgi:hypothetical protein
MILKNVVLHEIYSKKSVTEYVWHVSVDYNMAFFISYPLSARESIGSRDDI